MNPLNGKIRVSPHSLNVGGSPVVESLLWLPGNPLYEERPKQARALFTFRCSMCGNQITSEVNMQPMCTGPSWTNDHEPEVMDYIESGRWAQLAD
jgi:hypothetical protein